jgi:hypothetical protein
MSNLTIPSTKGDALAAYIILTIVSVTLLIAVVALLKERRLRLALQSILKRLLDRWRVHANTKPDSDSDRCNDHGVQ